MKLLGHRTANMTLRYVEITQKDLQREFHLARSHPRHLLPLPAPLWTAIPKGSAPAMSASAFPLRFVRWIYTASKIPPSTQGL